MASPDPSVIPGQFLAFQNTGYAPSDGTFTRGNGIYASLAGTAHASTGASPQLQVTHGELQEKDTVVPQTGDIVMARITKISPRFASVRILCVGNRVLKEEFAGVIRKEDVRATEIDKVEIYKSFRPGDVVLAEVISLSDSRAYSLSTAKNELGVVFAQSVVGEVMVPVSWQEMLCPRTKIREFRKVAQPRK
eukprot:gnl/Trimastix_PCT/3201.p1 GENE.gnl/Trimastix_PCT/3201~~gnl/Trimastix_PCT/3201.p1  ORF type:complete len:192 (+),score=23.51 gnl/Trimastix_PCT/3201:64-639(+)